MENSKPIRRALISVSDKTDLVRVVRVLAEKNVEILSTGGTADFIRSLNVKVIDVSEWTMSPELFEGRIKTLHPKVHGALLYKRESQNHVDQAQKHQIEPIDLVIVNLYPFENAVESGRTGEELIEQIDIGGPSMLRSAAKNHQSVTVICDLDDYATLIEEMNRIGGTTIEFRRYLAGKVFSRTANYDSLIARTLQSQTDQKRWNKWFTIPLTNPTELRYGENPIQKGALYLVSGETQFGLANSQVIGGKEISFNNWMDVDSAVRIVGIFQQPACVVVKHTSPCGVALSDTIKNAYQLAIQCDPTSAFGGVVAFNRKLDTETAEAIRERFTEVVFSLPTEDSVVGEVLSKSKNLRWVVGEIPTTPPFFPYEFRRTMGGMLVEEMDMGTTPIIDWELVTSLTPSEEQLKLLEFAWNVVKGVKSNAVVFAQSNRYAFFTIGIGGGETSRVDAVENALRRAKNFGHQLSGSVLASDAFFPFADSIQFAKENGVTAIVQPGGSIRDKEVIKAANDAGIVMMFTHRRHFRHL